MFSETEKDNEKGTMRFSKGDEVIIVRNGETATVVQVINAKIIEVETNGGEEITVLTKDVRKPGESTPQPNNPLDTAASKTFNEKPDNKREKQTSIKNGFFLSFSPLTVEETIQSVQIAFLNYSKKAVLIELQAANKSQEIFTKKQIVPPAGNAFLEAIPFSYLDGKLKLIYKIQQVKEKTNWVKDNFFQCTGEFILTPKKMFAFLDKMKEQARESFEVLLTEIQGQNEAINAQKPILPQALSVNKSRLKGTRLLTGQTNYHEIDLHTESLNITVGGLDNFEILTRQLEMLEKAIGRAIQHGQPSLIIIHGVGNGKLKEEVHKLLKAHPKVDFFQYNWRPNYGWGATEAFFRS